MAIHTEDLRDAISRINAGIEPVGAELSQFFFLISMRVL